MKVDVFIPCSIDQFYPNTGFNMLKILKKLGIEAKYNKEQTCCGMHAFNNGYWDTTKQIGEKFIREYHHSKNYIVTPSPKCALMVKKYYNELFHNSSLHNEYKQVQKNIFEFSDFLVNIAKIKQIDSSFEGKVTLHDSCASLNEYPTSRDVRTLLKMVKGLEFIEMKESTKCCGFGGGMSVNLEPIATALAKQKINNALATKAEYITASEATCLMHLAAYSNKYKLPIKTIHLVDILATGL